MAKTKIQYCKKCGTYTKHIYVGKLKEAEEHLVTLKKLIKENVPTIGEPEFLMIITGTDLAYTTENNVMVVPIGCLKN